MPIGVPKVAYRLPGETSPQWVDLYNRLYVERLLFFCQELEDELANQLIGIMVYLNAEDTSQELFMYINSPGGSVINGIAVFDTFDFIEADVNTICAGTAASMASFVLCNGTRDKRIALPHARIMIHQPIGGSSGQVSDVVSESEHVMSLRRQVCKLYSDRTGQPPELIGQDMDRDRFLSPKEAKSYGLVDKVAVDW